MVTRDRHFQYIQLGLTKAACAITKVVNDLLEPTSQPSTKEIVTQWTDALALLGHCHVQLSHRRSDAMKPALKKTYAGLVSNEVPITSSLFGDDVVKTMGEIRSAQRVQSQVNSKGGTYQRYPSNKKSTYDKKNWKKGKYSKQSTQWKQGCK